MPFERVFLFRICYRDPLSTLTEFAVRTRTILFTSLNFRQFEHLFAFYRQMVVHRSKQTISETSTKQ